MARKKLKAGEVLLAAGEVPAEAYQIVEGSVELTQTEGGLAAPLSILDRGALVGAEELTDGMPMLMAAQALGALTVEALSKEQASRLLGRGSRAAKKDPAPAKKKARPEQNALVALSAGSESDYADVDAASNILKPGLLRRILSPDFVDLHERLDVRVSPFVGDASDQVAGHIVTEMNQRRGLRAKAMSTRVMLEVDGNPVHAMEDLKRAATRWLVDNGGDVVLWGAMTPDQSAIHVRLFVRDEKPVDRFRIGDGWSMFVLPYPLDSAGAHRLHAAMLAAMRTKAAGKLLTIRRDMEVLMHDAREQLLAETPGIDLLQRAEDRAAQARVFANVLQFQKRAEDARTAVGLLDVALGVFKRTETPIEWAIAKRDRAYLGQFLAERTNDTEALRTSMADVQDALRVLRPTVFPNDWAALNDRLGLGLVRLDSESGDMSTLQRALKAFEDALSVYDRRKMPTEWAEAMAHFGQVALVIGREQRSPAVLLRAVEACNAVVSVRDRRSSPLHWASAQNNLGSALFLYGRLADDSAALSGARDAFETAHEIYIGRGSDRLAKITAKNLRHVEKALSTTERRATAEPKNLTEEPWRPNENEPPPLPWEVESDNSHMVAPSKRRGNRGRPSGGHIWFEDR